ncbi:Fic family protein [Chrysiogenes arsenatis]|uniref:Fic family protein n=1 Tax=Chrysiogenes arsenatis TaxID=309797 RepID=UPI000407E086|nr:hypothetical protein [Chrysiogenes arsenatis]
MNLLLITQGEMSKAAMMEALGFTGRDNFEKLYLKPALEKKLLEMTLPEKPKSRNQKYCLTAERRKLLSAT